MDEIKKWLNGRAEEVPRFLRPVYEFYRGWFKGVIDTLLDANIEDDKPGLDALIDHVVASCMRDSHLPGENKRR